MKFPIPTGGSAFPIPETDGNTCSFGMTLRDWFATQASEADIKYWQRDGEPSDPTFYTREEARYLFADAMLRVRDDETVYLLPEEE
jgi:hypothetical protein